METVFEGWVNYHWFYAYKLQVCLELNEGEVGVQEWKFMFESEGVQMWLIRAQSVQGVEKIWEDAVCREEAVGWGAGVAWVELLSSEYNALENRVFIIIFLILNVELYDIKFF